MDGVLYLFDKNKKEELDNIIKEWETLTKLTMETDEFEAFYQYAINDYIGISKGYSETKDPSLIKQKGMFIDKVSLGKGMQPMIIPYALNRYFCDKVPIEKTIKECKDINMFITYQKVDKKFRVEYNNQLITRINRYYMDNTQPYLFKCKVDEHGKRSGFINMLKDSGVKIVNNLDEVKEFPKTINYRYYIRECNKIIAAFQLKQLTLF